NLQVEERVLPLSQLAAVVIDYFIIKVGWVFTFGFFNTDEFVQLIYTTIVFVVIFLLVPLLWNVETIESKIQRLILVQSGDNQTSRKPLLKRTFALFLPFMLSHILKILQNVEVDMNAILYPYFVWGSTAAIAFLFIMWVTLFVHIVFVLMKKGQRKYY